MYDTVHSSRQTVPWVHPCFLLCEVADLCIIHRFFFCSHSCSSYNHCYKNWGDHTWENFQCSAKRVYFAYMPQLVDRPCMCRSKSAQTWSGAQLIHFDQMWQHFWYEENTRRGIRQSWYDCKDLPWKFPYFPGRWGPIWWWH